MGCNRFAGFYFIFIFCKTRVRLPKWFGFGLLVGRVKCCKKKNGVQLKNGIKKQT